MISYDPLFKTLNKKGVSLYRLAKDIGMSSPTRAKFNKSEPVSLDTIIKICKYLNVPIQDVVEVKLHE